jgi:hypothetical protein
MRLHRLATLAVMFPTALLAFGAQDSNRQLQQSLKDTDVHPSWIYNDVAAGFAAAKKTGKPLLVVFR